MTSIRRSLATLFAAGLVAVPLAVTGAAPASAAERGGRCDGARFELEVEREDGRFDVDADIDDARPGSRWRLVLVQDGTVYTNVVRRADGDGDVSVDRDGRPDTPGRDVFTLKVNKVGTSGGCARTIAFAS